MVPCGYCVVSVWFRAAIGSMWLSCGFRVAIVWVSCGLVWVPCGYRVGSCGLRVDSVWVPCGFHTTSKPIQNREAEPMDIATYD